MLDYNPLTIERELQLVTHIGRVTRSADFAVLKAILEFGHRHPDGTYQIRVEDIAEAARCQRDTVYKRIRAMQKKGYLRRVSEDRRRPKDEDRGTPNPGAIYEVLI